MKFPADSVPLERQKSCSRLTNNAGRRLLPHPHLRSYQLASPSMHLNIDLAKHHLISVQHSIYTYVV